jgi:hypothetical protein
MADPGAGQVDPLANQNQPPPLNPGADAGALAAQAAAAAQAAQAQAQAAAQAAQAQAQADALAAQAAAAANAAQAAAGAPLPGAHAAFEAALAVQNPAMLALFRHLFNPAAPLPAAMPAAPLPAAAAAAPLAAPPADPAAPPAALAVPLAAGPAVPLPAQAAAPAQPPPAVPAAPVVGAPPPQHLRPSKKLNANLLSQADNEGFRAVVHRILNFWKGYPDYYPHSLLDSVEDLTTVAWIESYFKDRDAAIKAGTFDQDLFVTDFVHYLCGEVRSASEIALEDLVLGKVVQGNQPVARYAEQFMQRVRRLPNESAASLCQQYLCGLNRSLRAECVRDAQHKAWTDLSALITASITEELKQQAARSFDTPSASAPSRSQGSDAWPQQSGQNHKRTAERFMGYAQNNAAKRRGVAAASGPVPMDVDAAPPAASAPSGPSGAAAATSGRPPRPAAAAATHPSASAPSDPSSGWKVVSGRRNRPNRPIRPNRPASRVYYDKSTGAVIDPLTADLVHFPLNGNKSKMTPDMRKVADDWGVCYFCRASREHDCEHCPNKPAQ